jgi:ATP-dependent RNA helicase RhlE
MLDIQTPKGFDALNLPCELCSLLKRHGIETPTPIQEASIPIALSGQDLIGVANTGTGKTLAFGLPMILRLKQHEVGLIIAPTRELAQQIAETYDRLGTRCILIVGGASMGLQINQLRRNYSVIVATPGRLIDHLERRTVNLSNVSILVLDEADRMLDMGFAPAIKRILEGVPRQRQTMLFSATMPDEIQNLANDYLNNAQRRNSPRFRNCFTATKVRYLFSHELATAREKLLKRSVTMDTRQPKFTRIERLLSEDLPFKDLKTVSIECS